MKFYTKYDRPDADFSLDQKGEPSLTRQSEADAVDINKIMERFDRTGQLPISMKMLPRYGDARVVDFQTAKQIVIEAESAFNDLPAKTRQYFGHDLQNLSNAISDSSEENAQKLLELGILIPKEIEPIQVLQEIASNLKSQAEVKA